MEGDREESKGVGMQVPKTPDKCKRDEWSEGGVLSLLDVYEAKWLLRNRAKLKGNDWEEIAQQVSAGNCGAKQVKTPSQCKNKIEAMKKRYRMESAVNNQSGSGHLWPFFGRMEKLVKGTQCVQPKVRDAVANGVEAAESLQALSKLVGDMDSHTKKVDDNSPTHVQATEKAENCKIIDVHGQDHIQDADEDDGSSTFPNNSGFSTPRNKAAKVGDRSLKVNSMKGKKRLGSDVAESIRVLAQSMLKIEQSRNEMYRDSERLRAEADIKRAEMDLKRTEIIAKTQLQIAKLFAKRTCNHKKRGESSLVAEHNVLTNAKERNG